MKLPILKLGTHNMQRVRPCHLMMARSPSLGTAGKRDQASDFGEILVRSARFGHLDAQLFETVLCETTRKSFPQERPARECRKSQTMVGRLFSSVCVCNPWNRRDPFGLSEFVL